VTEADVEAIAQYVAVTARQIKRSFCVPSGSQLVLAQRFDGYCIFWDGNCSIHPVKPRMCRQWPFISSLLVDMENWRIMASVCPGMRDDLSDEALAACLRKAMTAKPLP
jgi:Fe-S-cluster containining protein